MIDEWMKEWLSHATEPSVLYSSGALLLGVGYLVWRICRRLVRIGFFLFFSVIGFGIAAAASYSIYGQLAPFPLLASAGAGFGFFVAAVHSKVMKFVGAATVLVVGHTVGSFWMKDRAILTTGLGDQTKVEQPLKKPNEGKKPVIKKPLAKSPAKPKAPAKGKSISAAGKAKQGK
jgi:hypothetical protein